MMDDQIARNYYLIPPKLVTRVVCTLSNSQHILSAYYLCKKSTELLYNCKICNRASRYSTYKYQCKLCNKLFCIVHYQRHIKANNIGAKLTPKINCNSSEVVINDLFIANIKFTKCPRLAELLCTPSIRVRIQSTNFPSVYSNIKSLINTSAIRSLGKSIHVDLYNNNINNTQLPILLGQLKQNCYLKELSANNN